MPVRQHMFTNLELKLIKDPEKIKSILKNNGFDLDKPIKEIPKYDFVIFEQEVA